MPRLRTLLFLTLAVAFFASLYITATRLHREASANRVEIAMDWNDLQSLARGYDYSPSALLVAMRRAGLSSLAVSEELGGSINSGHDAMTISGQTLIDQAYLGGIEDATLARLAKNRKIDPDTVYVTIFNPIAKARYLSQLALHFNAHSVHVLRNRPPYLLAIRTEADYLSSVGLGLPALPMKLARDLHLFLIPRIQNDERFGLAQIQAEFRAILSHERVSTVIFFGSRNQVLGFPDHLEDTAALFRATHLNYGTIETYDNAQEQKGNVDLARRIIGQTVRVQAIAKPELDKLDFDTIVARYLLGARERNVRVIYVRPILHQKSSLSIQATNVEMIKQIAAGLQVRGLRIGRATPVPAFRVNPLVLVCATLATPAVILLTLSLLGIEASPSTVLGAFGVDILVFVVGMLTHHETQVTKLIALGGAIGFAVLAVVILAPRFRASDIPTTYLASLREGGLTLVQGSLVALGGALLVIALVSTPLTMEEVERFTGVKAILLVPPLLVLCAYFGSSRFQKKPIQLRTVLQEPVQLSQLLIGAALITAGVIYLARSGNQSDIAPSTFELVLRSKLTVLLSVRPRFKEFLIGFPAMMLLPSLAPLHRKQMGWLLALAIAVGLADTIDTFSHLHTPLLVSFLRLFNGMIIGVLLGALAIAIYRRAPLTAAHFETDL